MSMGTREKKLREEIRQLKKSHQGVLDLLKKEEDENIKLIKKIDELDDEILSLETEIDRKEAVIRTLRINLRFLLILTPVLVSIILLIICWLFFM